MIKSKQDCALAKINASEIGSEVNMRSIHFYFIFYDNF